MPSMIKLKRVRNYPAIHDEYHSYAHGLETAASNRATIIPVAMYDEGLGTPSALETHPENAAFAESNYPNCFVDSRIDFTYYLFLYVILSLAFALIMLTTLILSVLSLTYHLLYNNANFYNIL